MKSIIVLCVVVCLSVSLCKADNLTVGNAVGGTLAYLENVKLSGIPFTVREKNVFFSSEKNQIIRAITAKDALGTKGRATVTAGGAGATFANIKIKGERGKPLNYQVMVFV